MTAPRMLEGLRIVDLTTVIFGPYCTQILADLGAEVVKLEPAEGDSIRLIGTPPVTPQMSPVHLRLNRGKRSVDWDLKSEQGRAAMHRLVARSDIFIHNVLFTGMAIGYADRSRPLDALVTERAPLGDVAEFIGI